MTYIEFFDTVAPRNIGSCLTRIPDRVIMVGDDANRIHKALEHYRCVFGDRGHDIEFIPKCSSKNNLEHAVQVIMELVETYDDCVFDVTGGSELLLVALGIVYARFPEKNIQIHKCNYNNNTIVDCDKDGNTIYLEPLKLSVEENIRIYGGRIVYGEIHDGYTYYWNLTPEFRADVDRMWKVCRDDTWNWNAQIGTLEMLESVGRKSEDGLTIEVSRYALEHCINKRNVKKADFMEIITKLSKAGVITFYEDWGGTVTISYKNPQVKKCLGKAGLVLELKIFIIAKKVVDEDGVPVYDDALNGVVIDWNGDSDGSSEDRYDIENEIDVLLMHNVIPVFISCKNGNVTADELFKLNAVAERFGGPYAKKVLVTTGFSIQGGTGGHVRQRAEEMNIRILPNAHRIGDAELERKIKSLWCN